MTRPKGLPNHITRDCKQSIMSVYEALGGAEGMLRWATKNQTDFYKILVKILPKELNITDTQIIVKVGLSGLEKPINGSDKSESPPEAITSVH